LDDQQEKVDFAGDFWPIIECGLAAGFVAVALVVALIVGSVGEDPYAWNPSGEAWLLLLSGGFGVGFASGLSWAIWRSYFHQPEKEKRSSSDTDAK
jgi:hypothetical protein